MHNASSRSGFTLVELLVGVSVKDDTLFNLLEAKSAESPMPMMKTPPTPLRVVLP